MATFFVTLTAQYTRERAVLHMVCPSHWNRLYALTDKPQDGVVTPLLIAEVVALLAVRAQQFQPLLFQVQQLLEQHLLPLVLLLAMMEDAGQTSTMHCVIPMAPMVAVARTHYMTLTYEPR